MTADFDEVVDGGVIGSSVRVSSERPRVGLKLIQHQNNYIYIYIYVYSSIHILLAYVHCN